MRRVSVMFVDTFYLLSRGVKTPVFRYFLRCALEVLSLVVLACPLRAQNVNALVAGARLRIVTVDSTNREGQRRVIGSFDRITGDTLAVKFPPGRESFLFPLSSMTALDVSVSHRSASAGAWRGAGYGALAGLAVSAVFLARESRRPCDACMFSNELGVLVVAVPLTALSASVSAIVFSRRQDKWQSVELERLRRR
jgi:hypothetical protein